MNAQNIAYDVCRYYIEDNKRLLDEKELKLIRGWIRSRSLPSLASATTTIPKALSTRDRSRFFMQIEAFFKKNDQFVDPDKCRAAASKSFFEAEAMCRETNERLESHYLERLPEGNDLKFWTSRAKRYIDEILGDFDPFVNQLPGLVRVTSGATATRSRKESFPHLKIAKKMPSTIAARPLLQALSSYYGYGELKFVDCYSNRVDFVPKNWKTERTIACEPDGNMPLQLAFDTFAKRRLRARGIDLSDQSLNQELARRGSIDGSFATIDLSMASDTVAFNTVCLLFPYSWFAYLTSVRSHFGMLPGVDSPVKYEKFSSMGNGSTFAIETLVFAAACYAVGSKQFNVYGDDIAIETEFVDDLKTFLAYLGFVINTDKSFTEGPFRESCGTNWYQGIDITPFYLRTWSKSRAVTCHNVNGLVGLSYPGGKLAEFLLQLVKSEELPLVPFNYSSTSGVWISVHSAYSRKLLTNRRRLPKGPWKWSYGELCFKAYCPVTKYFDVPDIRTLFLWHLDKMRGESVRRPGHSDKVFISEDDVSSELAQERSKVPVFAHKYVRKWVHWVYPAVEAPDHLYWWSELLTRP